MKSYLQHIPLGTSLPVSNPHAISVSFPSMDDVIGYEKKDVCTLQQLQSGYPRFFRNKLVHLLCEIVRKEFKLPVSVELYPLPCNAVLSLLNLYFCKDFVKIEAYGVTFLLLDENDVQLDKLRGFLRQVGVFMSSRNAEDILHSNGLISTTFNEAYTEVQPYYFVQQSLQKAYETKSVDDIILSNCGMNAFFAVFQTIQDISLLSGKNRVLQLGNLYLDSYDILRTYANKITLSHVTYFDEIRRMIEMHHTVLSAVYVEVPNNPLLECVDLPRLYALCQEYNIVLLVDSSMASAHTLKLLPYCDVITESLSKFANGQGDVLMGAIVVNAASTYSKEIKSRIASYVIPPYVRDVQRLAHSISDYYERVCLSSASTRKLIEYLENSPEVEQVYSVLHPLSKRNFSILQKNDSLIPSVFSVLFKQPLAYYYDKLPLPKGPSFGTVFTLAMPYVYLAHFDLIQTEEGRQQLTEMGLHPDMLRISVGLEPVEDIIASFKLAGI